MNSKFEINGVNVCIHLKKNEKPYIKGFGSENGELDKGCWNSDKINLQITLKDPDFVKKYNFYPKELGLGNMGGVFSCDTLWWETDDFSGRFWKDRDTCLFYFTTLTFENPNILDFDKKIFVQNPDQLICVGEKESMVKFI